MESVSVPLTHILFDLDGTLVDSFDGIAASLRFALTSCGVTPNPVIERDVMGPPLQDVLAKWIAPSDAALMESTTTAFKRHYDVDGVRRTKPLDGVDGMLEALVERGLTASIVTNKRAAPAKAILEQLGWSTIFAGLYAPDSFHPRATSKADALGRVLHLLDLDTSETWYVGDRTEDGDAAVANAIPFAFAGWGSESRTRGELNHEEWRWLNDPMDVLLL